MNTVKSSKPALFVDWASVLDYGELYEWLVSKQDKISIVLLVPDPTNNDFSVATDFEPDVVLRNSSKKPLPDIAFKTAAILAVQDTSNLVPVIGIDMNQDVLDMYEEAGVIIVSQPHYVDREMGLR